MQIAFIMRKFWGVTIKVIEWIFNLIYIEGMEVMENMLLAYCFGKGDKYICALPEMRLKRNDILLCWSLVQIKFIF
jgi:hypothetical protein